MKLIPSIASSNILRIEEELKQVESKFECLHIDIEDGNFVPNITFGLKMVHKIREVSSLPFCVHLMVMNPEDYINQLTELGCTHIFVHAESTQYLSRCLYLIKKNGIKAGLAWNPGTDIERFKYLFDESDALLLMTSEPDYQGELFRESLLDRFQLLRKYGGEIWADGGIGRYEIEMLREVGVTHCVCGRYIFDQK